MSGEVQAWKNDPAYDQVHAKRFELSREWIRPHLAGASRILVCGDGGSFEKSLIGEVALVNCTAGDLRRPLTPVPTGHYDLVLCMEVLEHIHDQEAEKPTEWRGTGTRNLIAEAFRVLKPGGVLFLTTPNACSINVLFKVLTMQPPMVYRPHVREYAPAEIDQMLKAAGFAIERFETLDCWGGGCSPGARRLVDKLLQEERHHSPHRGEDIFVLARKPVPVVEKFAPNSLWGKASLDVQGERLGLFYIGHDGKRHDCYIPVRRDVKVESHWRYEVRADRLHLEPSLLCTTHMNGQDVERFHSAYHWSLPFVPKPADVEQYDHLRQINGLNG